MSRASMLNEVSFNKCKLGNEGLQVTFDALTGLRKLNKIDYSNNNVFDAGIENIST